jgi:hypothetical protein
LNSERTHPEQQTVHLIQRAFSNLKEVRGLPRILGSIEAPADLGLKTLRKTQAGSIIGCLSDAKPRTETLNPLAQIRIREFQMSLGVDPIASCVKILAASLDNLQLGWFTGLRR